MQLTFIPPDVGHGFSELQDAIKADVRQNYLPDDLRPYLKHLEDRQRFTMAQRTAKVVEYKQPELNTCANRDLSIPFYFRCKPDERQGIAQEFKEGNVIMPFVVFSKKHKLRWVVSDRFTMVHNYKVLNKPSMKVLEHQF